MEKLKTATEVAELYGYTEETVWKKCRNYQKGFPNGWPHRRDGRVIRFRQEDLDAIDAMMNPQPVERPRKTKRKPLAA